MIPFAIHHSSTTLHYADPGAPVAPILREMGLLALPCGAGNCGKCNIYANTEPCAEERRLLSTADLAAGLRLACHTRVVPGLEITIPSRTSLQSASLRVLTCFVDANYPVAPLVVPKALALTQPDLDDQRSDLRRLLEASGCECHALTLSQLAALPSFIRNSAVHYALIQRDAEGETLLGYGSGHPHLGLVVDIGTTTVAAVLTDILTSRVVGVRGERNAQAPWGADVISRITEATAHGTEPLRGAIISQINRMCASLLHEVGASDVNVIVLTGNTTMLHLACGLPAEHMSKAPFIPVSLEAMRLPTSGMGISSVATVFVMPCISGYIGADITAALLAADAHHPQGPFLLMDLGTNAELVLGVDGHLLACSAAAGPCFEGASLSCGMAGENGAIDRIIWDNVANPLEPLRYGTIGQVPARGLCGSGVLDTVALLLDTGLMDETGRLAADTSPLGQRVRRDDDGQPYFALTDTVRLTQRDIREVQLATAAVRAGVDVLLQDAGLVPYDVCRLYLAGGFGAAMNPRSAVRVGLVPHELENRIVPLGNAAASGALRYLCEQNAAEHAKALVTRTHYIELSAHPSFFEAYIERMRF